MKKNSFCLLIFTIISIIIFSSCTKDNIEEFSSQELIAIKGKWEITKFAGNIREEHLTSYPKGYEVSEEQIYEHNEKYLNTILTIEPAKISGVSSASELGYYYNFNELFDFFRIPANVDIEEPILYIMLEHKDYKNSIYVLLGSDNKAFVNIDGYIYQLKKIEDN